MTDSPSAQPGDDTVASLFLETIGACDSRTALRWRDGDGWASMSYREYGEKVARVAAGLHELGIRRGDRVVLMLRNIPEFHVVDIACVFLGAVPISIYNSSSAEQIAYFVRHSHARFAIVEDDGFRERFDAVRDEMPELAAIVSVRGSGEVHYADLLRSAPLELERAASTVRPDDLLTVIYTSGTTGDPKGVVITHGQVRFTTDSLQLACGFSADELVGMRIVSYLPMAHIAERMTSHYDALHAGYEVTTCPDISLVGAYLRDVRPNIMFGAPRVWEKIHAGVVAALAADPDKAAKFDEAVQAAQPIVDARTWERSTPDDDATLAFLDEVAFAPVRQLTGLDEVRLAVSSAAPIAAELLAWFRAIGVPLSELYGMSECCGPMTWAARKVKPGTVGPPIPGVEVRIASDGEVLCRGGNVFLGYLDDPERTAEALDADGWLHSGDIGELDEDGYLRIVDRKKEILITAGGKNVSPANLEAKLKLVPLIGQASVIGDNRPFVSALLVLDPEKARAFAEAEGLEPRDLASLARHPRVHEVVTAGVAAAMADFNHAEQVKRFVILGDEWLPDSDELTPTSKLKRRNIAVKYDAEIRSMYSGAPPEPHDGPHTDEG